MNRTNLIILLTLLLASFTLSTQAADIYFVNAYSWATVNAYCYTGDSNDGGWPGKAMEQIGTTADGYGIYRYTTSQGRIIFNNGNSGSGNQTTDYSVSENSGKAFDIGFEDQGGTGCKWLDLTKVDLTKLSHILIVGSIGGSDWSIEKGFPLLDTGDGNTFSTQIPIMKNSGNAEFLLRNWENLWGNTGTITSNVNWTWVKDGNSGYGNCKLTPSTTVSGLYTITYNRYDNTVAVTYPTLPVMTSVDSVSVTYNTATLQVASDNGVRYQVSATGITAQTLTPDANGYITITGLTEGKRYNFTVKAVDAYDNVSTAGKNRYMTTQAKYCAGQFAETLVYTNAEIANDNAKSFTTGFKYRFETQGTNLLCTFELLDTDKTLGNCWMWDYTSGGRVQSGQATVSGKKATYTFPNVAEGQHFALSMRFEFTGGWAATRIVEYTVGDDCGENDWNQNLATSRPCIAGYTPGNQDEAPRFANDGTTNTGWTTWADQPASSEWWYVDLGQYYQLNKIGLVWGAATSSKYIFQVRQNAPSAADETDDGAWYTVNTVSSGMSANAEQSFEVDVPARYVRFRSLSKGGNYIAVKEFRVYGNGYATEDNNKPSVSASYVSNTATTVTLHIEGSDSEDGTLTTFNVRNTADGTVKTVTTDASHEVTITYPTNTTYTLEITAMDKAGNVSDPAQVEFTLWNINTCLSENKTAKAENNNATANLAVDGNTGTQWEAGAGKYSWWYVDLGRFYDINNIKISWEYSHSTHFIVQTSQNAPDAAKEGDDTQWYTILDKEHELANTDAALINHDYSADVEANPARYVRFRSLKDFNTDWGGAKLKEFCVFGTGFAEEYSAAPEFTTITPSDIEYADGKAVIAVSATDSKGNPVDHFRVVDGDTKQVFVATAGKITISGLTTCEAKTVQIQAMDRGAQLSEAQTVSLMIPNDQTLNLARLSGVEVAAAGNMTEIYKINDNDLAVRWEYSGATAGVDEWVSIKLDRNYNLRKVKIYWADHADGARPNDYEFQTSYNGTDWITFAHYTTKPAAIEEYNIAASDPEGAGPVPARWFRLWVNKHDVWAMALQEIQLFGDCYGDYGEKPVMLYAETDLPKIYRTSATINVAAICEGVESSTLGYRVETAGGTLKQSFETAVNGTITLTGLDANTAYTFRIYAFNATDDADHRSENYKQVTFTTQGDYSNDLFFICSLNAWLGANADAASGRGSYAWLTEPEAQKWRFKTTGRDGFYRLEYTTTETWAGPTAGEYYMYAANLYTTFASPTVPAQNRTLLMDRNYYTKTATGTKIIVTATDKDHFVSNLQQIVVAGPAVGTENFTDATHILTWIDDTHAQWVGTVVPGQKYQIFNRDETSIVDGTHTNTWHVFTDVICPAPVDFDESFTYGRLTFNLEDWSWTWEPVWFDIYHYNDAPVGAVTSYDGGTIEAPIRYFRHFSTDWTTICLPFEVDRIAVYDEADEQEYPVFPRFKKDENNYVEGYGWMKRLDEEVFLNEFRGAWKDETFSVTAAQEASDEALATIAVPQKGVPYIMAFNDAAYFSSNYVIFYGAAGQTIDADFTGGSSIAGDATKVRFVGNNTMHPSAAMTRIYRLAESDNVFTRRESATVPAFEAYCIGTSLVQRTMPRLVFNGTDSAADTPTSLDDMRTQSITQGAVYAVTGQLIARFASDDDYLRILTSLDAGAYIVRTADATVKIIMGGK